MRTREKGRNGRRKGRKPSYNGECCRQDKEPGHTCPKRRIYIRPCGPFGRTFRIRAGTSDYKEDSCAPHGVGPDFAFVGNQYRIEVDGKEYFIDLLLYNRRLQAMIAIDLKIGEFLPEYKGKMEFYLNVPNDTVKLPHENPAIGIIICKSKSRMIVEYALKSSTMPIGVVTYSLSPELPEAYKELLPTSEEIAKKIKWLME